CVQIGLQFALLLEVGPPLVPIAQRGQPHGQIKHRHEQKRRQRHQHQLFPARQAPVALHDRRQTLTPWPCRQTRKVHLPPPITRRALTPSASRLAEPSRGRRPASSSRSRRRSSASKLAACTCKATSPRCALNSSWCTRSSSRNSAGPAWPSRPSKP